MNKFEKEIDISFQKNLLVFSKNFDKDCNLVWVDYTRLSTSYHTALPTGRYHQTRASTVYGLMLLDAGGEENILRGTNILQKIVELQDADITSKSYGIWSWYYEEDLTAMAPPDWNWADFIGKLLIQAVKDHSDVLPNSLITDLKCACQRACYSILRRQVQPTYTNIALMDVYMTMVTGETINLQPAIDYALVHLKMFKDYTNTIDSFQEYNSPTYTIVALEELSRCKNHIQNKQALAIIDELLARCWYMILSHYHKKTHQWSGPHARAYSNLINMPSLMSILNHGTNGFIEMPKGIEYEFSPLYKRAYSKCPDVILEKCKNLPEKYTIENILPSTINNINKQIPTSYLTKEYTLSTFSESIMWTQRKPCIAYWGNEENPKYFILRFMNNGYDFCSGIIRCKQLEGKVIGIFNTISNGGDIHPSLDYIIDEKFITNDLRIRLEVYNRDVAGDEDWACKGSLDVIDEDVNFTFSIPVGAMDNETCYYEYSKEGCIENFDYVFYSGDKKEIDLSKYNELFAAFMLTMGDEKFKNIHTFKQDNRFNIESDDIVCSSPMKPCKKCDNT